MRLKSISYSEYVGGSQEWKLEQLTLGPKNLLVGKNSAGKSRTINVLNSLARSLSTNRKAPDSGTFKCEWESEDQKTYVYRYEINSGLITSENLEIDGKTYLDRKEGGAGEIFAEKVGEGIFIPFQTPENEFAIMKKRDAIQHSFIEPLYQWAATVRTYHFGASLGKEMLYVVVKNAPAIDENDENQAVGIFQKGEKTYGKAYTDAIISDMEKVGYELEYVTTANPITIKIESAPGDVRSLQVKEKGLAGPTDQISMSQGMYRVLALLIHVNYLQFKKSSTCIMVDDIGEGLDYERSCKIISLLREKSDTSGLQIIMSTNDRFVMNEVPLKEWTILKRKGSTVRVHNYENSKEIFDDFKFTGLSNFSFFEMDFLGDEQEPN